MKIVYIADSSPIKKASRQDDLKQAAALLASQDYHSLRSKREAEKVLGAVLNKKATYTTL